MRWLVLGLAGCLGENDVTTTADITVPADVQADLADSFPVVVAVFEQFSGYDAEEEEGLAGTLCAPSDETAVLHLSEHGIGSCSHPDAITARILHVDVDPATCIDGDPPAGATTPIDGAPEATADPGYVCESKGQSSTLAFQIDF